MVWFLLSFFVCGGFFVGGSIREEWGHGKGGRVWSRLNQSTLVTPTTHHWGKGARKKQRIKWQSVGRTNGIRERSEGKGQGGRRQACQKGRRGGWSRRQEKKARARARHDTAKTNTRKARRRPRPRKKTKTQIPKKKERAEIINAIAVYQGNPGIHA